MADIIFTEGSGLQDSIYGKSQEPIKFFLQKRGEAFEAESIAKQIFDMNTSNQWAEKLTGMTAMEGFVPVGENGAYPTDGMQEGFSQTLEHMTWKNSFALSREIIEDSKLMDLRKKPDAFVTSYYRTREKFAAALLGYALQGKPAASFAGKSFKTTVADGKGLFAVDHGAKRKGDAQSNRFKDAFSVTALGKMEVLMQNTRGDSGEILDVTPDTIVIPNIYELKQAVFSAIGADKDPETSNNAFNYLYGRWNVIVWPYLNQFLGDEQAPWILMDSRYNKTNKGGVWFDRTKLEVRSTLDENTDANVWRGYARFIAGFNDWRFAYAGGLSTGSDL